MSWIEPPLPGRSSSSAQQRRPLPPLAHRSATAPAPQHRGQYQSVNDLLPLGPPKAIPHDRGATASAWSRKLPYGTTSKALRVVRTHLSPVEDAMCQKHSTNLREALAEAVSGRKYMKTMSVVRRSRSVPAIHRHALETALASHIVRAKVELSNWHAGIREISELRQARDAVKLRHTLDKWQFHSDDPVVVEAHSDLERWRYIETQMPEVLRKAVKDKDVATIRSNLEQLNAVGPSSVDGAREARAVLRRYDSAAEVIRLGVDTRSMDEVEEALDRWDFPEDELTTKARELVAHRQELLDQMKKIQACERIDGSQLSSVLSNWVYESNHEDYMQGLDVLHKFRRETDSLQTILREKPVNLVMLRTRLDSWPFSLDAGCAELREAREVMEEFESEVRDAIKSNDGHALQQLWSISDGGAALGELNDQLVNQGTLLRRRHAGASAEILQLVRSNPHMEAAAKDAIKARCEEWAFASNDPILEVGRAWLNHHDVVTELLAAQSEVEGTPEAMRMASALAFGVTPASVPTREFLSQFERLARELDVIESIRSGFESSNGLVGIKSFRSPDDQGKELVHSMGVVLQCLLTGSSSWSGEKKDTTWKGIQEVLNSNFLDRLGEVPFYISTGRRDGVINARKCRETLPSTFSFQTFTQGDFGPACPQLFEYLQHVFEFDDLLQNMPRCSPVADHLDKVDSSTLESVRNNMLKSAPVAAVYVCCGGQLSDLERCQRDSEKFIGKAKSTLLKVQMNLDKLSPLENLDRGVAIGAGPCDDAPSSMTLSVRMGSEVLGNVEISGAATGMQLKQLIAQRLNFIVPAPTSPQARLVFDDIAIQDRRSLASQGIVDGATLTMIIVKADPLLKRLDTLFKELRELRSADLDGPGARYIMKAGDCFKEVPCKPTTGRLKAALANFEEYLKDACIFVHDATKSKRKRKIAPCLRIGDGRISISSSTWSELPLLSVTTAICALDAARYEGAVGKLISEFSSVLRNIYMEFLPLFWQWSRLKEIIEESQQAAKLVREALPENLVPVLTDPPPTPATVLRQLQQLCEEGIAVIAPHVESLRRAAANEVSALLAKPDLSAKSAYIRRLLGAHLMPLKEIRCLLGSLAKKLLTLGSMPQDAVSVYPVYEVVVVIYKLLSDPGVKDGVFPFDRARHTIEDQKILCNLLTKWEKNLFADDARAEQHALTEQLKFAQKRLLELSPLMFQADRGRVALDLRSRIIFTWVALATGLLPLLPMAKELLTLQKQINAAEYDMKIAAENSSPAEAEQAEWLQVRQILHRSGKEPWSWLEQIGCQDAKGFYTRYNLGVDAVESRGPTHAPVNRNDDAPELPKRAHFKEAEEEEDEFEDEDPPTKVTMPHSEDAGEQSKPLSQSELGRDTSMSYDTEGEENTGLRSSPSKESENEDELESPQKSVEPEYSEFLTDEPSSIQQPPLEAEYTAEFADDDEEEAQPPLKGAISEYTMGDFEDEDAYENEEENQKNDDTEEVELGVEAPEMKRQISSGDEFEDDPKEEDTHQGKEGSQDDFEDEEDEAQSPDRRNTAGSMDFEEDPEENEKEVGNVGVKRYDSADFEGDEFEADEDNQDKTQEDRHGYDDFEDDG